MCQNLRMTLEQEVRDLRRRLDEVESAISSEAGRARAEAPDPIRQFALERAIKEFDADLEKEIAKKGFAKIMLRGPRAAKMKRFLQVAGYVDQAGKQIKPIEF